MERGPSSHSHHAVASKQQRRNLADGRRVAVVVTGQVPSPPAAVSDAVLAIVPWAENPVETEEQQNQQDAGRQTQSGHPTGKEERGAESNKQTAAQLQFVSSIFEPHDLNMWMNQQSMTQHIRRLMSCCGMCHKHDEACHPPRLKYRSSARRSLGSHLRFVGERF